MTDQNIETTVETVAEQVKDTGYDELEVREISPPKVPEGEIKSEDDEQGVPDEDRSRFVILVDTGPGPNFVIIAEQGDRYFQIQSSYGLWKDIANNISVEQGASIVPDDLLESIPDDHPIRANVPGEIPDDKEFRIPVLAAFEIIDNIGDEARKEIIYQLSEIFTNAELKHVVDSTDIGGGVTGFTVYHNIFPYEDDYSITDLNESIERVRMAAHRAELFLRYAFNLGVDIGRSTSGDVEAEPRPDRGAGPAQIQAGVDDSES